MNSFDFWIYLHAFLILWDMFHSNLTFQHIFISFSESQSYLNIFVLNDIDQYIWPDISNNLF